MKSLKLSVCVVLLLGVCVAGAGVARARSGGALVVAQAAEPKTLNPVFAVDVPTRDVVSVMSADLVHINRSTLRTEPALARSCAVSADGRHYTVVLRDGLKFSDGAPLTADDVVFSFGVYLDPRINAPQRDLLLIDGKPLAVVKLSPTTVRFDLPSPYAPGERLFDSFWILPKHKLERPYLDGRFAESWTLGTAAGEVATPGAFRLKAYVPGQRIVFERNPYYWKRDGDGQTLPYLDRVEIAFVADPNAQMLRLLTRESAVASRVRPEDFARLERTEHLSARDAGAGLEYNFLFFNWAAPAPSGGWFRTLEFRQAVAHAIDRDAIVRLVYQGRGSALSSQVTPANRLWRAEGLPEYPRDPARSAQLLARAGFRRDPRGPLLDRDGHPVEFSLMVSASNAARRKMATLIQEDLAAIGIKVRLQPTEFGVMTDAVLKSRRFDAAVWGIASGDADPNSDVNVWTTGGTLHVWNLRLQGGRPAVPPESWELDVDRLMSGQMTARTTASRKVAYDRVQHLVAANLPVIFLASPHVLAVGDRELGNFEPAPTDPVVLWNVDRLFWQRPRS